MLNLFGKRTSMRFSKIERIALYRITEAEDISLVRFCEEAIEAHLGAAGNRTAAVRSAINIYLLTKWDLLEKSQSATITRLDRQLR